MEKKKRRQKKNEIDIVQCIIHTRNTRCTHKYQLIFPTWPRIYGEEEEHKLRKAS